MFASFLGFTQASLVGEINCHEIPHLYTLVQ